MDVFVVLLFFINVITVKILPDKEIFPTHLLINLIVTEQWHGVCRFFIIFVG